MELIDAIAECQRWFDSLKRDEDRSSALQKLAADRRAGRCDDKEKDRRLAEIDLAAGRGRCTVHVYDGADLQKAVKVLIAHCQFK